MWGLDNVARAVAICHPDSIDAIEGGGTIALEGVDVTCGIVRTRKPEGPLPAGHALVRVRAFSCNYRDKALILAMAKRGRPRKFFVVGSEFVADVLGVAAGVTHIAVGDRVIGNGSYPKADAPDAHAGVPTDHGSRELQVLHAAKLIRIPANMHDEAAAAFPIAAQTTYAMIRRLSLAPGAHVLVTAARSNTSLFALAALGQCDATVYALTSAPGWDDRLRDAGADVVVVLPRTETRFASVPSVAAVVEERGGFDAVIDPFSDLYLGPAVDVLAIGGRYITCGVYDQFTFLTGGSPLPQPLARRSVLTSMIMKNLTVMGNCIGASDDLRRALDDHHAGRLPVTVDSVYRGGNVASFFDRTYNASDRFGKVVYAYD